MTKTTTTTTGYKAWTFNVASREERLQGKSRAYTIQARDEETAADKASQLWFEDAPAGTYRA